LPHPPLFRHGPPFVVVIGFPPWREPCGFPFFFSDSPFFPPLVVFRRGPTGNYFLLRAVPWSTSLLSTILRGSTNFASLFPKILTLPPPLSVLPLASSSSYNTCGSFFPPSLLSWGKGHKFYPYLDTWMGLFLLFFHGAQSFCASFGGRGLPLDSRLYVRCRPDAFLCPLLSSSPRVGVLFKSSFFGFRV